MFYDVEMEKVVLEKLTRAGVITKDTVVYARSIVRKDMLLLELANAIEKKIHELGGKPAFPVNLSSNEVAAHATPASDSTERAHGLLKIDIGVHLDGYAADTAFSVDLETSAKNKELIAAAEAGLAAGVKAIALGVSVDTLGAAIQEAVESHGAVPIRNLTGHSIEQYDLHAGFSVPNYANGSPQQFVEGVYAIEPFTTNGHGSVRDGKASGIYHLLKTSGVRDSFSRELIQYINETYKTLPFCERWIHARFGTRGSRALASLVRTGVLYEYSQLVEVSKGVVAQAEHTIVLTGKHVIVTTR